MEDKPTPQFEPPKKPLFEKMREEDSDFIPHVEFDEYGKKKRDRFMQKPYEPISEYEG